MTEVTTIQIGKKAHETVKELKRFYDAHSIEEVLKHGLVLLIDRSLVRCHDEETIKRLCEMRKSLASKLP